MNPINSATSDTSGVAIVQRVARRTIDDVGQGLLGGAHHLLATEGPGALTVRRIAQQAGTSTMNVYSRFGGKEGVVERLYLDGFARLADAVEKSELTDDPLEDLRACGRCYRRFGVANPAYYSLMFDNTVADFEPSESAKQFALGALGRVITNVQRAIDAGQIHAEDAYPVAIGMWGSAHGLLRLEMRHGDHLPVDWEAVYTTTMEHLIAGYAQPPPSARDPR